MERAEPTTDYSKKEAADIAGCDERTIHRAIKAQKLTARKEPLPGGGEKTLINGADLNAWLDQRGELKQASHSLTVTRQTDTPASVSPVNEEMRALLSLALENQKHITALMGTPLQLTDGKKPRRSPVPLTERLTVSVTEAAQLSGIPNAKARIREAIEQNTLKAITTRRGKYDVHRIMQDDLREWLKSLRG